MVIRKLQTNPKYIYENASEIDFFTKVKKLIEVKYYNEGLTEKQQTLFDSFKAKQKFIVTDFDVIEDIIKK